MNKIIQSLIKEFIQIEVSGKKLVNGTVIDLGSDMIVLFNGTDFMYIPLEHVQNLKINSEYEEGIKEHIVGPSIIAEENKEDLSFKEALTQAKGKYIEIYVTDNQPLHGYIESIQDDYFVFISPVYKSMYIPISHLKWLIPYSQNERPYGIEVKRISLQSNNETLESTFAAQIGKFNNTIVVLNIGGSKSYIGKINSVEEKIVAFQRARANDIYLNIDHIKTLHQV